MLRLFALTFALSLAPIAAPAQEAVGTSQADLPSYSGAFTLDNPTDATIHYEVRWGKDEPWKKITLLSHHNETHRYPLGQDPRAKVPTPYIRFDHIGGDNAFEPKEYRMEFYATGYAGFGPRANPTKPKQYFFQYAADGKSLDVHARP